MIPSSSDKHFLHSSVVLRHANGDSGEAEHLIETILTEAAVAKRRVWVSSVLLSELRPSTFVPGRFPTLFELTRYVRTLATLVTPDPNAMLRVARLRDAKWRMPGDGQEAKPRTMSLSDAMQVASALWVKEAIGVPDLEFLTFDDWCSHEPRPSARLCTLHLQDYEVDGEDGDVKAPIRVTRLVPVIRAPVQVQSVPAG
ncbi:MAG TPA: hypothetical protein VKR62_13005 [Roseiarcus sp.]|nr:hypothetical protein [Roseiarcus sp.]